MNDLSPKRLDKFKAYRARKKAAGLREVRLWLPDVRTKEFWEQSVRCALVLKSAPEEDEAVAFLAALQAEDSEIWD